MALLNDPFVREHLNAYLAGTLNRLGSPAIAVNSVADHVHILCMLSKTMTVSKIVEEIKTGSSKWIKTQSPALSLFGWQNGYGAFSVGQFEVEAVTRYIQGQDEHHRDRSFQDELRVLLSEHQIDFDERYLWD